MYDEKARACFPSHRIFKIYGSFVAFFIPLLIMIVTYALTMSALQQAHTTKKKRYTRRQRMHAVVNLATMAMRWKRAVSIDTTSVTKSAIESSVLQSEIIDPSRTSTSFFNKSPRKRASSLLVSAPYSSVTKHLSKRIFVSNSRLHETSKPTTLINWCKQREKPLQPLPEKSSEFHSSLRL